VRISIDAGTEETFAASHQPRTSITLEGLLRTRRSSKSAIPHHPRFSFVIVWDGITVNGQPLCRNIDEMALAARLAADHGFDLSHSSLPHTPAGHTEGIASGP